jgi:hypothetical protein
MFAPASNGRDQRRERRQIPLISDALWAEGDSPPDRLRRSVRQGTPTGYPIPQNSKWAEGGFEPPRVTPSRKYSQRRDDSNTFRVASPGKLLVGRGGLEPPRVTPLAPKASASANFAIRPEKLLAPFQQDVVRNFAGRICQFSCATLACICGTRLPISPSALEMKKNPQRSNRFEDS